MKDLDLDLSELDLDEYDNYEIIEQIFIFRNEIENKNLEDKIINFVYQEKISQILFLSCLDNKDLIKECNVNEIILSNYDLIVDDLVIFDDIESIKFLFYIEKLKPSDINKILFEKCITSEIYHRDLLLIIGHLIKSDNHLIESEIKMIL